MCIVKRLADNASVVLHLETLPENMCSRGSPVLVRDQLPEDLWLFPQQPWNYFRNIVLSIWSLVLIFKGFREKFTKSIFFLEEVFKSLSQFGYYYKITYCKHVTISYLDTNLNSCLLLWGCGISLLLFIAIFTDQFIICFTRFKEIVVLFMY